MEIRPALESDAFGIATVQVRVWQAAYRGIVPDAHLDSQSVETRTHIWREVLARGGPPEVWVATVGPEVVGWIAFGRSRDADSTSTSGEVEAVYVAAQYWGTGVGRGLWLVARNRLVERGFTMVTLWVLLDNTRAIRFYLAAGFAPDPASEKQHTIGGKSLKEMRYGIKLD